MRKIALIDIIDMYLPARPGDSESGFLCPFHDDETGTLELDRAEKTFRCRDCGARGDAVDFVRMYEAISAPEALDRLENWPGE